MKQIEKNIQLTSQRGERLDEIQDKTDALAGQASQFRRGANRVRKQMRWKDMKMRMCIIIGIIVLLIVIIVPSGKSSLFWCGRGGWRRGRWRCGGVGMRGRELTSDNSHLREGPQEELSGLAYVEETEAAERWRGGEQRFHVTEITVVSDWSETTWRAREHYTYPYHLSHATRQMLGSRYWRFEEFGAFFKY